MDGVVDHTELAVIVVAGLLVAFALIAATNYERK